MRKRKQSLDDLDRDIREHLDRETEDNIARGMSFEEARQAALRTFGNVALVKEDTRAVWTAVWLQQLLQDVRYGLRMSRRNPGFTAVVVLTLALGIGMNTAVFSVFNAVLLRPLAYPNPERLVSISTYDDRSPFPTDAVLGPDFVDWRDQAVSFEHVVAYDQGDETLVTRGIATQTRIAMVSEGFWELSAAKPVLGRLPARGERNTILVSHRFFERSFQGDPDAVGESVTLDGRQVTIVGVLSDEFLFQLPSPTWPGFEPKDLDGFRTEAIQAQSRTGPIQLLTVIGKLKPGVTIERARAEIETIRQRTAQAHPAYPANRATLRLVSLQEELVGQARLALWVLMAAVGVVLLIACANVANLLLGRASARQKEIAIRTSLGAGRTRVFRQLLVESLVLALLGGATGLLLARWALGVMVGLMPQAVPRLAESTIDGGVVAFTMGSLLMTVVLFGVGPAAALWKVDYDVLNDGARGSSRTSRSPRVGTWLVAVEMALAVVLLTGAGLLAKSFWRLNAHPPGFEPQHVLVMKVQHSGPHYREAAQQREYAHEFLRRVQAIPGVSSASLSTHGDTLTVALVEGAPQAPQQEMMRRSSALLNATSEGFADVMGLRVLHGRWISDTDSQSAVVVNESLARRDFPGQDAVGRRIKIGDPRASSVTIVGVVADLKYSRLDASSQPEIYVHYSSSPMSRFTVVVRTAGDPLALAPTIWKSVSDIDKTQPVSDVMTLEQSLADSISPRRFNLTLLGTFAAAALLLALVGIYGVIAYSVTERTHEIGVRIALGAERRHVVRMVIRQGMTIALAGIAIGTVGAALLTRYMENLLFDVKPADPGTFVSVAVLLAATAFIACWGPALKAALIDPIIALRCE